MPLAEKKLDSKDQIPSDNIQYDPSIPTENTLASIGIQGERLWGDLSSFLLQIDRLIAKADLALDKLQPSHTGKIRIAWWTSRASIIPGVAPFPVIWNWKRNQSKWLATKVSAVGLSRRIKVSRDFYDTRNEVREVTQHIGDLFKLRSRVIALMSTHAKAVSNITTMNLPAMEKAEASLNAIINAAPSHHKR